jgi:disulfide bond formation protein DsbB
MASATLALWLSDRRRVNLAGFLACALLMAYALYAEHVLGFEPCPLCMFQRVGVIGLGAIFLIAALHHPAGRRGARLYAALVAIAAAFPLYVSGRHVYIQSLPEGSVPACGASFDYMMDVFPLMTVVQKVLTGAGECQKIDWTFLGLSMPGWVFLSVAALAAWGVWANARSTSSLA